jgi:hypothetical protein
METILIKIKDSKKTEALKVVLKAMDIDFESANEPSKSAKRIAKSIKKGLEEVNLINEGKIKPTSLKDFLDEL